MLNPARFAKNSNSPGATDKRWSIDAVPIQFNSTKVKQEKCITGDALAPQKKSLMLHR